MYAAVHRVWFLCTLRRMYCTTSEERSKQFWDKTFELICKLQVTHHWRYVWQCWPSNIHFRKLMQILCYIWGDRVPEETGPMMTARRQLQHTVMKNPIHFVWSMIHWHLGFELPKSIIWGAPHFKVHSIPTSPVTYQLHTYSMQWYY
jgi:hypothetical protein